MKSEKINDDQKTDQEKIITVLYKKIIKTAQRTNKKPDL